MDYVVEVRITLKPGVMDAEGETIKKSLDLLGYSVKKVESIKVYAVTVDAGSREKALSEIEDACKKLLANPVIQDYKLRVV